MAKTKISEYSSTANSNTDIASINIDEGCAPSGINNAIRALMAQLKDFQTGAAGDSVTVGGVLTVTGGSASAPAITTSGDTNTGVLFPAADTVGITTGGTERVRVDSSGNLGLGVTPSAWSLGKAIEVGYAGSALWSPSASDIRLSSGANYNSGWKYSATGNAVGTYEIASGAHIWKTAGSGTAGNAITFTQAMTLDASGRLLVGGTSPVGTGSNVSIYGPNRVTDSWGQLAVVTTDGYAANKGGQIVLGGVYNSSGSYANFASISGRKENGSDVNSAGYLAFSTAPNSAPALERARIDSSGCLLVGTTTSPSSVNIRQLISGTSSGQDAFLQLAYGGGGGGLVGSNAGAGLTFYTYTGATGSENYSERARIDSSGNLLVGQTSISQTNLGFHVEGQGSTHRGTVSSILAASTNAASSYNLYSTGAGAFRFYVGMAGNIYATSTTITGISDRRLKENIRDLDDGLSSIMALQPRKFDWKEGKGADIKNARGFIAQEFETVFPDLIDEWRDPVPEGEEPYKSVRADLIPVLVKAIQEQQAIIQQLQADVAALKGQA